MEKGKIKKIMEKNTTTGKPFKSLLIDETWYNSFDANINNVLCEGEIIEFDYEEKGKFKNLTKLIVNGIDQKMPSELLIPTEKTEEIIIDQKTTNKPDKDAKIGRMACLNTSVEIHKQIESDLSDKDLLESVKRVAEDLERWVNR